MEDEIPADREEFEQVLARHQCSLVRAIGRGSSAIVYLVKSLKYVDQPFVCKRVLNSEGRYRFDELGVLKQLNNKSVIRLYAFEQLEKYTYLFIEYCPGGSVDVFIQKKGRMSSSLVLSIAKSLLLTLKYIHSKGIAHCDIKPENMLIDKYGHIKFADFGLSSVFQEHESTFKVGSLRFLAPEVLLKNSFDPFATDIWSLGISLYNMYMGKSPWPGTNRAEIIYAITNYDIPYDPEFSKDLIQVFNRMITVPKYRYSIDKLLEETVLKNVSPDYPGLSMNLIVSKSALKIGIPNVVYKQISQGPRIGSGRESTNNYLSFHIPGDLERRHDSRKRPPMRTFGKFITFSD